MLLVQSEIYYVPIGDGWEDLLVHNVLHCVAVLHPGHKHLGPLFWAQMALASLVPFQGPKKSRFSGSTPSNAPHNNVAPIKIITYRAIKTTGTLIVIPQP